MNKGIKTKIKILWGVIFFYSGLFFLIRKCNNLLGRRLTIVTYHRFTKGDISKFKYSLPFLFVSTKALDAHLDFYKKNYRLLNFEQLSLLADKRTIPPSSLIITFDDGYGDNLVYAAPLMRKYNCPWIIFLTSGFIGSNVIYWWDRFYCLMKHLRELESKGSLPSLENYIQKFYLEFKKDPSALFASLNKLPTQLIQQVLDKMEHYVVYDKEKLLNENRMLDWKDVKAMSVFTEFGAHSHLHLNLCKLEEQHARKELHISKKIIEERTGKIVLAFSYPAGELNKSIEEKVKTTGYSFAVTVNVGINDLKNHFCLKRINIWEGNVPRSGNGYSKG